jgi:hypothetical protein
MKQRIHVVGVGGPGMSAIAQVLIEMGHRVSGSDIKESETIERLRGIGVVINIGHDAGVVHHCDAVTASTAIPAKNVELTEALNIGVPVLTRAQMLAAICRQKLSVGVAGTHGKTTTSSMLMTVMREAQLHPSFIIGGDVRGIGSGASWGSGKYLVVEADESDGTFLGSQQILDRALDFAVRTECPLQLDDENQSINSNVLLDSITNFARQPLSLNSENISDFQKGVSLIDLAEISPNILSNGSEYISSIKSDLQEINTSISATFSINDTTADTTLLHPALEFEGLSDDGLQAANVENIVVLSTDVLEEAATQVKQEEFNSATLNPNKPLMRMNFSSNGKLSLKNSQIKLIIE